MSWLVIVLCWVACAPVTAGWLVAYFQRKYPNIAAEHYRQDLGFAWLFGLMGGPPWMAVAFCFTGFAEYGWSLRRRHE